MRTMPKVCMEILHCIPTTQRADQLDHTNSVSRTDIGLLIYEDKCKYYTRGVKSIE